ncbi:DUF1524 domain-containing protein [Acidipropionibacterium acidipropionici]|uniref:Calcium-binding protein n=1 Tax=Acidipropionibacterium acidipropionici TaxID=1748 RepID=A0AAC9ANY9_9ACTN|nr:calcium-binding protein [Acidipropionibacterium acidipropionici]AOZ47624.1 calcium-binding protein [Acidipropionibacterium acidipropionici]AZP39053.1 DUF1524 domain-containing protein [Acidipropionibacterium acidipropionici]
MILLAAGGMTACSAASPTSTATPSSQAASPAATWASASPSTTPQTARNTAASRSTASRPSSAARGTAAAMLETLPVKGRAPKTGYTREQFGQAWADVDHNGCDTRNDILHRDLTGITTRSGTRDCIVTSGTLQDPYTGTTIHFVRGEKTSSAVQIDHVVALSDAWQTGAQKIGAEQRRRLANDPLNLLAADGPANQQKSDGDAATWLPSNKAFRCQYVARQVAVKHAYKLWVTQAEKSAISSILSGCKGQKVPTATSPTITWTPRSATTTKSTSAASATRSTSSTHRTGSRTTGASGSGGSGPEGSGSSVSYKNCAAARAAGAAPIHRGDPGYSSRLDRDGDGVACE